MHPVRKPTWQQATALVSLSTCGAMTGFAFAHGTVDDMTSPTRMPVHLLALKKPAKPVSSSDSALRSAIVNVANYYLRMAQTKSPAEMEALIWESDSIDGVDHGESCAAFASLTLALGAQATGQQSWVTGGTTYPWPLHQWADVRVDPNPASPAIISVLQDAQAHNRWHPLGDGYQPQPGDWVMFDGHVEVVTRYSAGSPLHDRRGLEPQPFSQRAHVYRSAGRSGRGRFRQQRRVAQRGEFGEWRRRRHGHGRLRGGRLGYGGADGRNPGAGPAGRRNGERRRGGRAGNPGGRADVRHRPNGQRRPDGWAEHRDRAGRGTWARHGGEERYGQDGGHSGRNGKHRHAEHGVHAGRDGRSGHDGWRRRDGRPR